MLNSERLQYLGSMWLTHTLRNIWSVWIVEVKYTIGKNADANVKARLKAYKREVIKIEREEM